MEGVEEGKQAVPCPKCKETFEEDVKAYLTSRLATLGLDAANGVNRLFYKSGGVPGNISFNQFLRCIFGTHGQAGTGIRRLSHALTGVADPLSTLRRYSPNFQGKRRSM